MACNVANACDDKNVKKNKQIWHSQSDKSQLNE